MQDLNYTVLEIIEDPRRLMSVDHDRYIDYIYEVLKEEDERTRDERFFALMRGIISKYWWCFYGLCVMCSDTIPFAKIFSDVKDMKPKAYTPVSTQKESRAFDDLMYRFNRGIINEHIQRERLIQEYIAAYAAPDYNFIMRCVAQEGKEQILPMIKKMWMRGLLPTQVREYFSFCSHPVMNRVALTDRFIPIRSNYRVVHKIGSEFLDENYDFILDKRLVFLKTLVHKLDNVVVNGKMYHVPMICDYWIDASGNPILEINVDNTIVFQNTGKKMTDADFVSALYSGFDCFISTDDKGNPVGKIDTKNGIDVKTVKIKFPVRYDIPLILMNISISILVFDTEEDTRHIAAFVPKSEHEYTNGEEIKLIRIGETYYIGA